MTLAWCKQRRTCAALDECKYAKPSRWQRCMQKSSKGASAGSSSISASAAPAAVPVAGMPSNAKQPYFLLRQITNECILLKHATAQRNMSAVQLGQASCRGCAVHAVPSGPRSASARKCSWATCPKLPATAWAVSPSNSLEARLAARLRAAAGTELGAEVS